MRDPYDIMKQPGLVWPVREIGGLGLGCCCDSPLSCEDPERPICYVDKYATGSNDGSSWNDAFTSISSSSYRWSTHRTYIRGYGETDPYNESLSIGSRANLIGVGDLWISGYVECTSYCCLYNITVTGSYTSRFYATSGQNRFVACAVKNIQMQNNLERIAFWTSSTTNTYSNCIVSNYTNHIVGNITTGFRLIGFQSGTLINCIVEELRLTHYNTFGTGSIAVNGYVVSDSTGCLADGISNSFGNGGTRGFALGNSIECIVDDITGSLPYGFYGGTRTDCYCITEPSGGCFFP